jgi:hypothetical protein
MIRAPQVSEKEFQATVLELAQLEGWLYFHTFDARRSNKGFPDLVLVRPPRVIFCELKSEKGRTRPEQVLWAEALAACPGVECHLWRPQDWDRIVRTLDRRPA